MVGHNKIVFDLETRLEDSKVVYDLVSTCKEYRVHGKHGECDVFALHGSRAVIIEIKSNDRVKGRYKAMEQLDKDNEYIRTRYKYITTTYLLYAYSRPGKGSGYNIELIETIRG